MRYFLLILACIVFVLLGNAGFSQQLESAGKEEELSAESIGKAFERAIEDIEAQKKEEKERLKFNLSLKFDEAAEEWISSQKGERALQLNKLIEQKWEYLLRFGPHIHHDYYLRGYAYEEKDRDIVATESLVKPYVGHLNIVEKLFVERSHSSNVSFIEHFIYTAITPIRVTFEYDGYKFTAIDTAYGQLTLEEGWKRK